MTPAGQLTVLVDFDAALEGRHPEGPLLKLGNGQFLGTTVNGALIETNSFGLVHRLSASGTATTIATFPRVLGIGFMSELTQGPDGNLYGATRERPFKISTAGVVTPHGSFASTREFTGAMQASRLAIGPDGNLFGTISEGGVRMQGSPSGTPSGLIYRVRPSGDYSRFYQFLRVGDAGAYPNEHGETPYGGLTLGLDGQLYGTTGLGGAQARGTFFKIDTERNLTTLASFNASTGLIPLGDLVFADGAFYGCTLRGGDNDTGTFFSATPAGQITRISSLPANLRMQGRLALATDGNFYGVSTTGGANNTGTAFRLTKAGALTMVASMDANTGPIPRGVMQASDGNFYGVTQGTPDQPGSIFRLEPNGAVSVLVRFNAAIGHLPGANLMQASDGHLYGTTGAGGPSRGGVVYRLRLSTGNPEPSPSVSPSPSPTATPPPPAAQLANISTRLHVGSGENVLIGGFIISGDSPKRVIMRAIAPSLQSEGAPLPGTLADPVLELFDASGNPVAANDNWRDTQQDEINASTIPPSDDREAAIVAALPPGNHTAIISGKDGATGLAVVEVYDLDAAVPSKVVNVSSRGFVGSGDALIGGVIVTGAGNHRTIVRALGPSLAAAGVADPMQDSTLELFDNNGNSIAANDDWKDSQQFDIDAAGFAPPDERESAIIAGLQAGNHTAIVRGKNGTTGVAVVEVYSAP